MAKIFQFEAPPNAAKDRWVFECDMESQLIITEKIRAQLPILSLPCLRCHCNHTAFRVNSIDGMMMITRWTEALWSAEKKEGEGDGPAKYSTRLPG